MIKLNGVLRIIEFAAFGLYTVSKIINIVLCLQIADIPPYILIPLTALAQLCPDDIVQRILDDHDILDDVHRSL